MSISNLQKGSEYINVKDIISENANISLLELENLVISSGVTFPDPLVLNNDLSILKNVSMGDNSADSITINGGNVNHINNVNYNFKNNDVNSLKIVSNAINQIELDTTTANEVLNINCNMNMVGNDAVLNPSNGLTLDAPIVNINGASTNLNMTTLNNNCALINNSLPVVFDIQDNDGNAFKIQSSGGDLARYDTTTGAEQIRYDCSLNVFGNNNNINCNDGRVLANNSGIQNALSYIFYLSGSHVWSSGQAPNANILNIVLDGDLHQEYVIDYDFEMTAVNSNFFLKLNFNSDLSADYYYRRTENVSGTQTGIGANEGNFIDVNAGIQARGSGTCKLYLNRTLNNNVEAILKHSYKTNGANAPNFSEIVSVYDNTLSANITSMQIDVFSNEHTGVSLRYKIYRMN